MNLFPKQLFKILPINLIIASLHNRRIFWRFPIERRQAGEVRVTRVRSNAKKYELFCVYDAAVFNPLKFRFHFHCAREIHAE